jgi:hypothetical protein
MAKKGPAGKAFSNDSAIAFRAGKSSSLLDTSPLKKTGSFYVHYDYDALFDEQVVALIGASI